MTLDRDAIIGSVLGLAVGDALGLPCENLSPRRAKKLFPHLDRYQFFFRRGLFSDDTEHSCLTGQALLVSGGDAVKFQRDLARRLRWWAAGIPAGTGRATIRACAKLWLGWAPDRSGVFSAGNGPAMRVPILGLCFGPDPERLKHFVRMSTRITHTDPKAEVGALAVAWATYHAAKTRTETLSEPAQFLAELRELLGVEPAAEPLLESLEVAGKNLHLGRTTEEFALDLGLKRGATGYMYHTVPVALYAWLRYPDDFRTAVQSAIRCGGDTDTTAAITGSLVGARVGKAGIPAEWLRGAIDWPRSVRWVEKLAGRVAEGKWLSTPQHAEPLAVWALPIRNAVFFVWVLVHAARRLLPPY
ncbi:ADP-ribosyl-[dinitrogen reductase] glycohydrolase [Gemmata sp. SH-PL17]|uniref:ADP-ribosylglycohydrolase family protein n=1 Tax=Gemmata sp. SH-PL17 TaxID=1630693 RepID=UPI0004B6530E|nr:ADP-ribosylglycohydrolase family protein [Gemmata sp. SH-PL17]AMV27194.1 ADP-ribosyl-[dinitrogen reductase] glycohydrolase [Gemmata sp. SH-PL17]